MADYKISLGAEVRTSEIDKQVKNYKGDINVGAILDTSGITKTLNAYNAAPIEVGTTLITKGITDKIASLNKDANRKKIKVGIDPDHLFDGIETIIANKTFDTPLKVKVDINWTGVKGQIANPTEDLGNVFLDAKLNTDAISGAIKDFNNQNSATKIEVNVDPQFDKVEEKVKNYTPRTLMKINSKVNKSQIDASIRDFTTSRYIEVNARLKDGAIESAVTKYVAKEQVPIAVDFIAGSTKNIDEKILHYKNTPVEVPVKLAPAKIGFTTGIKNKPITIDATLEPENINKVIDNFVPRSKIKVDVSLIPKDINAEVRKLSKPTEPIDVDVRLNTENINNDIALIKPITKVGVSTDLILEDVDDQIRAYVPQAKIKVNLDLNDENLNSEIGKQNQQNPILVNVKLDKQSINDEIKAFKPELNQKIRVGVQLDFKSHKDKNNPKEYLQKSIDKQIKDFEAKTKVKVGVELDPDSVNNEVKMFVADVPIKLGVELDPDGVKNVKNQIDDLRKQLEKLEDISININSNVGNRISSSDGTENSSVVNNAMQSAQQAVLEVERIISSSAEKSIKNVTSKGINRFFEVDPEKSNAFRREMDKLVKEWTNGKGKMVGKINIETRTSYDEDTEERIERLYRAQVTYNNELGKTIQKTIEWTRIGTDIDVDGKESPIYGFAEVSAKYSDAIDKTKNKTDAFVKQQKKAVADLTNDINELNSKTIDQNASKPIKEQSHLNALETKYNEITDAIARMGNASSTVFDDARNDVNRLISEYKILAQQFKNAESVATSLRSKDIDTVKSTYDSKLDVLISKMRKDGVYTSGFERGAENLRSNLANATDASELIAFLNGLDKLEAGYKRASAAKKEFNQSQNVGIKVSGLESQIANIQRISPEIDRFEAEINGAKVTIKSLLEDLSKVKTQGDFTVVNQKFKAFADSAKAAGIAVAESMSEIKTVEDIKIKIDTDIADDIHKAHSDFERLSDKSDELRRKLELLDDIKIDLDTAKENDDIDGLIDAYRRYEIALKDIEAQLAINKRAEQDAMRVAKEASDDDKLKQSKISLSLDIDNFLKENSAAAKEFGARIQELRSKINDCDKTKLSQLKAEFANIKKEVKLVDKNTQTFTDKLKSQFSKYATYFSISSVFMYATQGLRSMFEQVKLIDSAMTELKKVTNETEASYNKFLSNAAEKSKKLGTTIDGLVSSTADFARLGYGFEDAQGLAEVANIYAVVGDEIEGVEGATQSLVSTLAAFKKEMGNMNDTDFAMSIVDKMNEVANNYAISSGGIGEALQRSASSMAAANNSLDETIALITAANEIAQNPEKVGNAMKTISMRIRGAKTELEEAGESTDGMAESTASLRQEMLALSGVDILKDKNTFKSTYQIMDELSQKWENLTDIQRATITELVAGRAFARMYRNIHREYI